MKKIIKTNQKYLSQVIDKLPSNCIFNKNITNCGGTTLELNSSRNSLIIVSNLNLLIDICKDPNFLGVYNIEDSDIIQYCSSVKYKKIIAVSKDFNRILSLINPSEFFLLIDEYIEIDYKYMRSILDNFNIFKEYCFMTSYPIDESYILKELQNIPIIEIQWEHSVPVNIDIHNTSNIIKELASIIEDSSDYNLHIFLNSVSTIRQVIKKVSVSYRVVIPQESLKRLGGKINISTIDSSIEKINFYLAGSFNGISINDPIGKTVIVSDTEIARSSEDISAYIPSICGRVKSPYSNVIVFIGNISNNKYLKYKESNEFYNICSKIKEKSED